MSYSDDDDGEYKPQKKKWATSKTKKASVPFYKKEIIYNEQKLKIYAINKLSKQDWGRKELLNKMKRYQPDESIINGVLDKLETQGYLSDKRRINSVFNQFSQRESTMKTAQRLAVKGFTKNQIKEVLEERAEEESEDEDLAFNVLDRKYSNIKGIILDYSPDDLTKTKEKMTRFMLSRGFSFDEIKRAIQKYLDSAEDYEVD